MAKETVLQEPRTYHNELQAIGRDRFMEKYNHPWLVSFLEESCDDSPFAAPTVRVRRSPSGVLMTNARYRCIPLDPNARKQITIGRAGLCDITVDLETLSGYHAIIGVKEALSPGTTDRYASRRFQIRDLDSSNGTRVNDVEIEPNVNVNLSTGDVIEVGGLKLQYVQGESLIRFLEKYQELF